MLGEFRIANNVRHAVPLGVLAGITTFTLAAAVAPYQKVPDPTGDTRSGGYGLGTLVDSLTDPTKIEIVMYSGYVDHGDGTVTLSDVFRGYEGTTPQTFLPGACFFIQAFTAGMEGHSAIFYDTSEGTLIVNAKLEVSIMGVAEATFPSMSVASSNAWLPVATMELTKGSWLVLANLRTTGTVSLGSGSLRARLFDVTNGNVINRSETRIFDAASGKVFYENGAITDVVATYYPMTLRLEVYREGSFTDCTILSDANGRSRFEARQLI